MNPPRANHDCQPHSSPNVMNRLPQELKNFVIDYLPVTDIKSMRLVHRTFDQYGALKIFGKICTPSGRRQGSQSRIFEVLDRIREQECIRRRIESITFTVLPATIPKRHRYLARFHNLQDLTFDIRALIYATEYNRIREEECVFDSLVTGAITANPDVNVRLTLDNISPGESFFSSRSLPDLSFVTELCLGIEDHDEEWSSQEIRWFRRLFRALPNVKRYVVSHLGENEPLYTPLFKRQWPRLRCLELRPRQLKDVKAFKLNLLLFLERHIQTLTNLEIHAPPTRTDIVLGDSNSNNSLLDAITYRLEFSITKRMTACGWPRRRPAGCRGTHCLEWGEGVCYLARRILKGGRTPSSFPRRRAVWWGAGRFVELEDLQVDSDQDQCLDSGYLVTEIVEHAGRSSPFLFRARIETLDEDGKAELERLIELNNSE